MSGHGKGSYESFQIGKLSKKVESLTKRLELIEWLIGATWTDCPDRNCNGGVDISSMSLKRCETCLGYSKVPEIKSE